MAQRVYPRRLAGARAVSYLCYTPGKRGKFFPRKAKALGIKPGPLFSQLVAGESVTLDDGRTVHPHEVRLTGHLVDWCVD